MSFIWGKPSDAQDERQELAVEQNELQEERARRAAQFTAPPVERPKGARVTAIARGLAVTGDLGGEGDVFVEGALEGKINIKGTVTVAPSGSVRGTVAASVVQVSGVLTGNVMATDLIELSASGLIDGDIIAPALIIERGGCLNGRAVMEKGAQCSAAPAPEQSFA